MDEAVYSDKIKRLSGCSLSSQFLLFSLDYYRLMFLCGYRVT